MPLRTYQTVLLPNTLYAVGSIGAAGNIQPCIEVIGTAITLYGSLTFPAAPPAAMYNTTPTPITGIETFASLPNYIYYTGAATSVTVSGMTVTPNPTS